MNRHNPRLQRFDTSIFTGEYVTGDVSVAYLQRLERSRNDEAKEHARRRIEGDVIELHNSA